MSEKDQEHGRHLENFARPAGPVLDDWINPTWLGLAAVGAAENGQGRFASQDNQNNCEAATTRSLLMYS